MSPTKSVQGGHRVWRAKRWHETAINPRENRVQSRSTAPEATAAILVDPDGPLTNDQYYMGVDKATLLNTPEEGLTEVEAERRLQLFGTNELSRKRKTFG